MRFHHLGFVLLAACAGTTSGDEAGAPSDDPSGGAGSGSGGTTGNGVSFGGAQDIGEFRAALDRGEIPRIEMFDANGFFNEHYNAPPQITCGGTLCLTPGLAVGSDWRTGGYQAALQISMSTYVDPATYERLPMRLVVVVDHSGSMASDDRLTKVKVGLHTLIDNLHAEDRLAIVSFDDVVTIDRAFGDERAALDRAALHAVVDALQPAGGTNIYDGLDAGLALLGDAPPSEKQNRVILLSDGLATAGNTSQTDIVQMATGYITRGIGLTTIGVGNDFDVQLMRGLAERGAGNFYYVEDATAANEVFTEELDYFMSPLAMDIKLEATAGSDWELHAAHGSNLWAETRTAGMMKIPAVFLASRVDQEPNPDGGRRGGGSMIFVDMQPKSDRAGTVATLNLSYRLPGQTERFVHQVRLDYDRDPSTAPEQPYLSEGMAERYAMYNMFLGLRRATQYAATYPDCAAATLDATARAAAAFQTTHGDDPDLAADLELVGQFRELLSAQGATGDVDLATCPAIEEPLPGLPVDEAEHGHHGDLHEHGGYGCATGARAPSASWLFVVAALALRLRRRR